jgi:hypothetical protein
MQPANTVKYYGPSVMEAMRQKRIPREIFEQWANKFQALRPNYAFASGGMVSGAGASFSGRVKHEVEILLDPGLVAKLRPTADEMDLTIAAKYKAGGHVYKVMKER